MIVWGKRDGHPSSQFTVWGIEFKSLFSVFLVRVKNGGGNVFHSHAFNSISWLFKGKLFEQFKNGSVKEYIAGLTPIFTYRNTFHKVTGAMGNNWFITFRGPWVDQWKEDNENGLQTLTHGRKVV